MKDKEEINIENEQSLMAFLKEPTLKIAETLTGILASEKKDWKLSAGKLVQSAIKGSLLTQLGREIEQYRKEGKIKEDYFATDRNRSSFYEILKFLDEEAPDKELFTAAKSIFFSGIAIDATIQDEVLAYEFIKMIRELSGIEILILRANYEIVQNKAKPEVINRYAVSQMPYKRSVWRGIISMQMGSVGIDGVVRKYERNLESLGLISPRNEDNRFVDDFEPVQHKRLTETGFKFCEFITNFN